MYVCLCQGISEAEVRRAGHAGVTAPEDLATLFGLDAPSCCGRCLRRIARFAALAAEGAAADDGAPAVALPSAASLITEATRALVRSALHRPRTGLGTPRTER